MNPRAEAQVRAGDTYDARVLEPSPPAVNDGPWFADDPVAPEGATRPVVSPVSSGDVLWSELAAQDESLAAWCRESWLGPHPPLAPVPPGYEATRVALHAVAEHVLKPAREKANGKIGLRYVRGGFGTPFFGDDVQLAVRGATLHVVRGGEAARTPLTSLAAATEALGDLAATMSGEKREHASRYSPDILGVDETAATLVGDWFGFAFSVLEELRARANAEQTPSRVQIWPEHFDAALELGAEAAEARAAYGCSPGDEQHPEPYLYVAPWTARPIGELWNAQGFPGAELPYADLLAAADPRALALEFFAARAAALG
jgi:hypothetical protein